MLERSQNPLKKGGSEGVKMKNSVQEQVMAIFGMCHWSAVVLVGSSGK